MGRSGVPQTAQPNDQLQLRAALLRRHYTSRRRRRKKVPGVSEQGKQTRRKGLGPELSLFLKEQRTKGRNSSNKDDSAAPKSIRLGSTPGDRPEASRKNYAIGCARPHRLLAAEKEKLEAPATSHRGPTHGGRPREASTFEKSSMATRFLDDFR